MFIYLRVPVIFFKYKPRQLCTNVRSRRVRLSELKFIPVLTYNDLKANHSFISTGRQLAHSCAIEVLQGARLSLNGFSYYRFSQDSPAFPSILRVNGIGRSMAKTIAI